MANRQAKLNINGVNYKITGIGKAMPYKDILCTIAKQNEIIDSREIAEKCKAKQMQKLIDGKKITSLKSKGRVNLKDKELHEMEKLRQIKVIYIGQNEDSEKSGKKRRSNIVHKNRGPATERAQDDSDIEVYHKSRRRMKQFMKRKWREESDKKMYHRQMSTNANLKKTKPILHSNQGRNMFMSEWDKISIYYLDEVSEKKQDRTFEEKKSNGNTSIGGLLSKASSVSRSMSKKSSLKSLSNDFSFGDDKDSGIPSWESEEISSKDDNRADEKACNHKILPVFFENCGNEVSNQDQACLELCIDHSNDSMLGSITGEKMGEINTKSMAQSERDFENKESQKWGRGDYDSSSQHSRECCIEETNKREDNFSITLERGVEEDAAACDFEIIKAGHVESSSVELNAESKKLELYSKENKCQSEKQQMNIVYDINSNAVHENKTVTESEIKFNLENRGSFILIEFDDNKMNFMDKDHSTEDRHEELLEENPHRKDIFELSLIKFGEKAWPRTENEKVTGDKVTMGGDDKLNVSKEDSNEKAIFKAHEETRLWQKDVKDAQTLLEEKTDNGFKVSDTSVQSIHNTNERDKFSLMEMPVTCKLNRGGGTGGDFNGSFIHKNHAGYKEKIDLTISLKENVGCERSIKKKQEKDSETANEIGNEPKKKEKLIKDKSKSGEIMNSNIEEVHLTEIDVREGEIKKEDIEYITAMCRNKNDDKLIAKFVRKFAKQIEDHLKTKFHNQDGRLSFGDRNSFTKNDKNEIENLNPFQSNGIRRELWKRYMDACVKVYRLLEIILYFDLKIEQRKFELEEIMETEIFYNDGNWSDDENEIVKDIVEFREFLKKVTIMSRKNRLELRETQAQIEKVDVILLRKRSLIKSIEESIQSGRCQNIPRKLLRSKKIKGRK